MKIRCPHCHNAIEMLEDSEFSDMSCESCGSHFDLVEDPNAKTIVSEIQAIDRSLHVVRRSWHRGGWTVYRSTDTKLDRTVAVKIPRKQNVTADDQEQFLREARAAAQLAQAPTKRSEFGMLDVLQVAFAHKLIMNFQNASDPRREAELFHAGPFADPISTNQFQLGGCPQTGRP